MDHVMNSVEFKALANPGQTVLKRHGNESLSTCSTLSSYSLIADKGTFLAIKEVLSRMVEEIAVSHGPQKLSYISPLVETGLNISNCRRNRVLTKIMSNFEFFVNESYLGLSQKIHGGYSGLDAFVAKDMIEGCIRQIYPYVQVEAYGSLSTGLWLPGQSDIDLLVCFNKFTITEGSMLKYFPPISPPPLQLYRRYQSYAKGDASTKKNSNSSNFKVETFIQPQIINPVVQNAYIHSWTQLMNKLYLQNGDIKERNYSREELLVILESIELAFSKATWFREVKLIKSSMPVVKLKVCCGHNGIFQIPVDVSVSTNDHAGLQARDYVCRVMSKCPGVFRPLVLVLKQILREHNLHDVYTGGLGSYTLSLMVVFFLTRCGFKFPGLNEFDEYVSSESVLSAPSFHLPPNPLPNQFSTSKSELEIDDKGMPPLLDINYEEKYKSYPFELNRLLEKATNTVLKVTSDLRSHLLNTKSVRRSPELLGCLFIGFLRLFSLKEDGGIDLSYIGFTLQGKGGLFLKDTKPHSGILIECPVTKSLSVGSGSYNILKIQALFSTLRTSLITEPQKLLFFLKFGQHRLSRISLKYKNSPEGKTLRRNSIKAKAHAARVNIEPNKKKKFELDIADMDRQLAAVHEARYKRRLKESNLARFQSETLERKKTLAERFAATTLFRREKDRSRKPVIFKSLKINEGILKSNALASTKNVEKLRQTSETFGQADFWENKKRSINKSTDNTMEESEPASSRKMKQASWATVVKSPSAGNLSLNNAKDLHFKKEELRTNEIEFPRSPYQSTDFAYYKVAMNKGYVAKEASIDLDQQKNLQKKKTNFNNNSRKLKHKEDKLQQKPSTVLFIGNLSYHAKASDIEELKLDFGDFGKIINSFYDKKQGMLWLRFSDIKSSTSALKHMDQRMFLYRPLYVDFSQMPTED